jgi:hypothetical protein
MLTSWTMSEVFLPFPGENRGLVAPMTHVKGTWLASAVLGLREHGSFDAYQAVLDPRYREVLSNIATSEWHPVEVMLAHYDACERLEMAPDVTLAIARNVTSRAQGGVLSLTARLAASTVVTPWVAMGQLNRLWSRMARGGGIAVFKLGPKEARIEIVQFPGSRFRYCQISMRGILQGSLAPFCRRVFVTELPAFTSPTQMATRVAWA